MSVCEALCDIACKNGYTNKKCFWIDLIFYNGLLLFFAQNSWVAQPEPRPWTWLNMSGEIWKWLCAGTPHPTWWSLRGPAQKNWRNCTEIEVPSCSIIKNTLGCNSCQRCFKVLSKGCEYLCTCYIFLLNFNFFHCHYGIVCRILGKKELNQFWRKAVTRCGNSEALWILLDALFKLLQTVMCYILNSAFKPSSLQYEEKHCSSIQILCNNAM